MKPAREPLLQQFLDYLSVQRIPDQYFPQFEAEAVAFRARFHRVPLEQLAAEHVETYVDEARLQSLPERALRNRRVACDAFLGFVHARANPHARRPAPGGASLPAAPAAGRPGAARGNPADKRRAPRISFITKVYIDNVGTLRCSDLSIGGMYLETVSSMGVGTMLAARFKLRGADPEFIVVTMRVAFEHHGMGAGVEFVRITREDARRIAEFVVQSGGGR